MSETPDEKDGSLSPRKDQRVIQRALKERWPIPESIRAKLLQKAVDLVDEETEIGAKYAGKPRVILAALKTIQGFDRLSLDERRLEILEAAKKETVDEITVDVIAQAKAIREKRRGV
jgi:hypothetical protein